MPIIEDTLVSCPFCHKNFARNIMYQHIFCCQFSIFSFCPRPQCFEQGLKNDILAHEEGCLTLLFETTPLKYKHSLTIPPQSIIILSNGGEMAYEELNHLSPPNFMLHVIDVFSLKNKDLTLLRPTLSIVRVRTLDSKLDPEDRIYFITSLDSKSIFHLEMKAELNIFSPSPLKAKPKRKLLRFQPHTPDMYSDYQQNVSISFLEFQNLLIDGKLNFTLKLKAKKVIHLMRPVLTNDIASFAKCWCEYFILYIIYFSNVLTGDEMMWK